MGRRLAGCAIAAVVGSAFVSGDAVSATVSDPAGYCEPASAQYDPGDLGSPPLDPLPAGVHERFAVLNGIRTSLLESGPRSGQTAVVFVHGNPGSSRDFADLVGRSGALGLRTLAFDLPGFGLAARPWSFPYTAAGELDWFTAAIRQLGVHRAILVVHDIGGPLAMQWAAEHGSALVAAVIIDSGVLVGYQDHYLARIWKTPVGGEQFMLAMNHELFQTGIENGQQRPLPQRFVDRMYAEYDRPTRCAILSLYRSVPDVDAYARAQASALAPLDRPALVVWGEHDPYLPPNLAYAQRDAFPHADIHVLGDAAHWPFVDDREQVDALVTAFLTRWAPASRTTATPGRRGGAKQRRCRSRRGRPGRRGRAARRQRCGRSRR
jgi:pimeloyl-ACP methyl ester carboxylesterase